MGELAIAEFDGSGIRLILQKRPGELVTVADLIVSIDQFLQNAWGLRLTRDRRLPAVEECDEN